MTERFERELAIFSAARRLPAGERAAYLDEACAGDAAFRERIEQLLRTSEEAGEFLQEPAPGAERSTDALATLQIAAAEKVGDRIGRYKLLQQIGEGGCGVVYMAEQEEPVRRRVALKVIKLGMDTKSVIARFEAERQALALMDHPNIAKVLDAGATANGRPYFVMELVRGLRITDYCDEARLSTRGRLDLFIQVCHAIQHAHQKGIIHRDIKPSNILVTVNDGVAVPKVIDFGIAKATSGQQLTDKTLFTAFEQFIGTPAYMSPEQAVLTSVDIDTRSDIYALGVLLYELLTGKTPFEAKELLAIGLDEMRRTIREREPSRPSARLSTLPGDELSTAAQRRGLDAPKLVTELRGDLDWIIMKALEKDRGRRYETASSLAADIQRYLDQEPILARPPSKIYRLQKMVRRNKAGVAAAAIALLALFTALSTSTWAFARESAARKRAIIEATRSRQVADFLKDMISGVDPSLAHGGDTTVLRTILDQAADRVATELKAEPAVQADLYWTLAESYNCFSEDAKTEKMNRLALALTEQVYGHDHTNTARALRRLASTIGPYARSRPEHSQVEEAEKLLSEALRIFRSTYGEEHPKVADIYVAMSFNCRARKNWAEAESLLHRALAILRRFHGGDTKETVGCLYTLGNAVEERGDLAEAEKIQREVLQIKQRLFGETNLETIESITMVADLARSRGNLAEAEALHRQAVGLRRQYQGNEHIRMPWALYLLAQTLQDRSKFAEAEVVAREGLQRGTRCFGSDRPGTDWNREMLASILVDEGKWHEAETLAREELVNCRKRYDTNSSNLVVPLEILGESLHRQGNFAEAEMIWRESIENVRSRHPTTNDHLVGVMAALGDSLANWAWNARSQSSGPVSNHGFGSEQVVARVREAERLLRDCFEIRSRTLTNTWRLAKTANRLGFALVVRASNDPTLTQAARLEKLAQAELLLLQSHQTLQQSEEIQARFKRDSFTHLFRLYRAWSEFAPNTGREQKETEWSQRLFQFDSTPTTNLQREGI